MNLRTGKNRRDSGHHPTASVVDGTLILTLPNARTPTVWRMGLDTAATAAFKVIPASDDDGHTLVMISDDDQQHIIASYDDRDHAVTALLAASGAMQDAGRTAAAVTQPRAAETVQTPLTAQVQQESRSNGGGRGRAIVTTAGIILIVVLLYMIANTGPQRISSDGRVANSGSGNADAGSGQRSMSAEQFLQQRQ